MNDGADVTGPYFDANIPNNVTAIVGKSAFLRCKVRNLGNKTVNYENFPNLDKKIKGLIFLVLVGMDSTSRRAYFDSRWIYVHN